MWSQSNDKQIAWFNSSHFVVDKIIKQGQIQKQEGKKGQKEKKSKVSDSAKKDAHSWKTDETQTKSRF